jgi:hypothetical protein
MSRRALAIAVIVIVALLAAGLWLLGRDATLQWAVREAQARAPGELAIERASGSLLSRVRADRVRWRGESNAIDAEDVVLSWSPLWLLVGVAAFDSIHARSLSIASTASTREPMTLPEKLSLPVRLRFDDATVDAFTLASADGDIRRFEHVKLSFATGPDRWKAKLAGVQSTWGTLRGHADVATSAPIALEADARGDMSSFELDVDAKAQTSAVKAKLRIAPLAPQPVMAIDAALRGVDVRHLFPDAPQAVLDGTVEAATAADDRLRGSIDLTNRAAGTVDQRKLPIVKITAQLAAAPERWWLEGLVIDGGGAGKLAGTGWVSANEAGFILLTEGVDLHSIHPALVTTRLAGNLYASGPFERQRTRFTLADRRIALAGDVLYEPDKVTIDRLNVRAGAGRFDARGSLGLDDAHAFALKTRFASLDLSQFGTLAKANLNGHLAASGELGPVPHVRADGRLSNSTLFGLPVSAEGRWASKGQDDPTIGFDLRATVGQTRLKARGSVADPKTLHALDVALDLDGQDLQELYTISGVPFPSTPAYRIAGNLSVRDDVWSLRGFNGTVGRSDLTGDFVVDARRERPFVRAELTSRRLDMTDLGGFIGHDYHAPDPAPDKLLPHFPFRLDKLNAANVDVRLTGQSFRNEWLPLRRLTAHLRLDDGRLTLDPLTFRAAGGSIDARIAMDARRAPIRTVADINARGLQLARLAPSLKETLATAGAIDGRTELAMAGDSFASMLASADGSLILAMNGGTVSDLVLRLANLDVANSLVVLARGDRQIPLRCVVADFEADDGVLRPRTLLVDSEHTVVRGEGTVDMGSERLALRLIAEPKDGSAFALRGPIRVDGTLKDPAVHPELGNAIVRVGAAVALGALAPPAAIIPFLQTGTPDRVDCAPLIEEATRYIQAKSAARDSVASTSDRPRD